jgi:hypothetical protein
MTRKFAGKGKYAKKMSHVDEDDEEEIARQHWNKGRKRSREEDDEDEEESSSEDDSSPEDESEEGEEEEEEEEEQTLKSKKKKKQSTPVRNGKKSTPQKKSAQQELDELRKQAKKLQQESHGDYSGDEQKSTPRKQMAKSKPSTALTIVEPKKVYQSVNHAFSKLFPDVDVKLAQYCYLRSIEENMNKTQANSLQGLIGQKLPEKDQTLTQDQRNDFVEKYKHAMNEFKEASELFKIQKDEFVKKHPDESVKLKSKAGITRQINAQTKHNKRYKLIPVSLLTAINERLAEAQAEFILAAEKNQQANRETYRRLHEDVIHLYIDHVEEMGGKASKLNKESAEKEQEEA